MEAMDEIAEALESNSFLSASKRLSELINDPESELDSVMLLVLRSYCYQQLASSNASSTEALRVALDDAYEAIGRGPNRTLGYLQAGLVLYDMGKFEEAEDMFKKAIEMDQFSGLKQRLECPMLLNRLLALREKNHQAEIALSAAYQSKSIDEAVEMVNQEDQIKRMSMCDLIITRPDEPEKQNEMSYDNLEQDEEPSVRPKRRYQEAKKYDDEWEDDYQKVTNVLGLRALWVSGLPVTIHADEIRRIFTRFGEIELVVHPYMKTFAFVHFANAESVTRAVAKLNHKLIESLAFYGWKEKMKLRFAPDSKQMKWYHSLPPDEYENLVRQSGECPDWRIGKWCCGCLFEHRPANRDIDYGYEPRSKQKNKDFSLGRLSQASSRRSSVTDLRTIRSRSESVCSNRFDLLGGEEATNNANDDNLKNPTNVFKLKGLWIGGLRAKTDTSEMRRIFVKFGQILDVKSIGQIAFVYFDNAESATKALEAHNNQTICLSSSKTPIKLRFAPNHEQFDWYHSLTYEEYKQHVQSTGECHNWRLANQCPSVCEYQHLKANYGIDYNPDKRRLYDKLSQSLRKLSVNGLIKSQEDMANKKQSYDNLVENQEDKSDTESKKDKDDESNRPTNVFSLCGVWMCGLRPKVDQKDIKKALDRFGYIVEVKPQKGNLFVAQVYFAYPDQATEAIAKLNNKVVNGLSQDEQPLKMRFAPDRKQFDEYHTMPPEQYKRRVVAMGECPDWRLANQCPRGCQLEHRNGNKDIDTKPLAKIGTPSNIGDEHQTYKEDQTGEENQTPKEGLYLSSSDESDTVDGNDNYEEESESDAELLLNGNPYSDDERERLSDKSSHSKAESIGQTKISKKSKPSIPVKNKSKSFPKKPRPTNLFGLHALFVGELRMGINSTDIRDVFRRFGQISDVIHPYQKPFAFIHFASSESPVAAISELNNKVVEGLSVDDNPLKLQFAPDKNETKWFHSMSMKQYETGVRTNQECHNWRLGAECDDGCLFEHRQVNFGVDSYPNPKKESLGFKKK